MSLSSVLQIAQNSLTNMTRRTAVVARNISEVNSADYSRRDTATVTTAVGARVVDPRRATDLRLERATLAALSDNSAQQLLSDRLDMLHSLIAGGDGGSFSDRLTELHNNLQTYSASPDNALLGGAVVTSARELVLSLTDATSAVQAFRAQADKEIGTAVDGLNRLLGEFETVNNEIVQGTTLGRDVNDQLDRRSALLTEIAGIVPVNAISRSNNDLVLITVSGTTLFETTARTVAFTPTATFAPGMSGNPVFIDMVRLTTGSGPDSAASGSLEALLRLRDGTAVTLQNQLDETARGLIESFAERDPAGGPLPPLAGLFTYSGGPALPPSGMLVAGLAADLSVNAAFDPDQGGNVALLRDGGANGAAYVQNTGGYASFADRLITYAQGLDGNQGFDAVAGLSTSTSLVKFAGQSLAWFGGKRADVMDAADRSDALYTRLAESLANATGVNMDTEMAKLGELEHGYEASARLIRVVDQMLQDLMDAVR